MTIAISNAARRLELEVKSAWEKVAPPNSRDLFPSRRDENKDKFHQSILASEQDQLAAWLQGRKFDSIFEDSSIDTEQPFFYLSNIASCYYLGGYLLHLLRYLQRPNGNKVCSLAVISLSGYLASERFINHSPSLNDEQLLIVTKVIKLMLRVRSRIDIALDERHASKLRSNLKFILNS